MPAILFPSRSKFLPAIGLLVRSSGDPIAAKMVFDHAQAQSKSISTVDPVAVAGVGDQAYWAGGKLNQLNVLKGKHWLIISVFPGNDNSMELAKQAALRVLGRLP